jgi:hypothetical protein
MDHRGSVYENARETMTEAEIKQVAEARVQKYVLAYDRKRPRWLLADTLVCSLDSLMQACNTDTWEDYVEGRLMVTTRQGEAVSDGTDIRDWSRFQPLRFVRRRGFGRKGKKAKQ